MDASCIWHKVIKGNYGLYWSGWDPMAENSVTHRNYRKFISWVYSSFLKLVQICIRDGTPFHFWVTSVKVGGDFWLELWRSVTGSLLFCFSIFLALVVQFELYLVCVYVI